MTRAERLRRTAKLCLNCLQNCAYLRVAADNFAKWEGEQFWGTTHNNFLDTATLDWCKVFADPKGVHYWKKSVTDHPRFLLGILNHVGLTTVMFDDHITEMKTYRDKFVAHLDEDNNMDIPHMSTSIKSTQFLYHYLEDVEDDCCALPPGAPANAVNYYRGFLAEAQSVYAQKA